MSVNQHLKEVALLGTSKRTVEIAQLPEVVAALLQSVGIEDEETRLLNALSLHHYYEQAGRLPARFEGEIVEKPIEEQKQEIQPDLVKLGKKILALDSEAKNALLVDWMDLIVLKGQITGPELIIPLLSYAQTAGNLVRVKAAAVIGEMGEWIREQHEAFQWKAEKAGDANLVWQEGTSVERRAYFLEARAQDPKATLSLLKSSWEQEHIRDKSAFLAAMSVTLQPSDLSFLEDLLQEEFLPSKKEKKTQRACRMYISQMLLCLPESKLHRRTIERLAQYIPEKKGILSKVFTSAKLELELPELEDSFWNGEYLWQEYGFEKENPDIDLYKTDQLYWFSCFVESIPIQTWSKLFGSKDKQTIDFLLNSPRFRNKLKGKFQPGLLINLRLLAIRTKEQQLILALLNLKGAAKDPELLSGLSIANWEAYVSKQNLLLISSVLVSCPHEKGQQWSEEFCTSLLRAAMEAMKQLKLQDYRVGITAAPYFNAAALPLLKRLHEGPANAFGQYNFWNKHIYLPILESTEIRAQLEGFK